MKIMMKKRQLLTASLVVALAAAVAVNWVYSKPKTVSDEETVISETVQGNLGDTLLVEGEVESTEEAKQVMEYFADARISKSESMDEIKKEIDSVLESDCLDEEGKKKLTSLLEKMEIVSTAQTDCENLIKAKLSCECMVIIKDDTAQVIIEPGKLNENTTLQITEIMEQNANISPENLTIIEAK